MTKPHATREQFEILKDRWMADILEISARVVGETTPVGSSLPPMSAYHFATGGKRLRALIPIAVAEALDVDPRRILGFSAACEILHNATLVHDDLQDGDTTRRGQPTVWKKYGSARAINLGDAMLYWTIAAAIRHVQFDDAARLRLVDRLVRDTLQVIDGQEREFLLQEAPSPTLADYTRMVVGKTSGLFALPLAGAAELCGASDGVVAALADAASHLGVIFQLQDDVLDLYGEKGREQRGSDIGEGKISALVGHFFEHGPTDDVAWLRRTLAASREELTDGDVERAAQLFREHGSLDWVLGEIRRRQELVHDTSALHEHARLAALVSGLADLFVVPIGEVR